MEAPPRPLQEGDAPPGARRVAAAAPRSRLPSRLPKPRPSSSPAEATSSNTCGPVSITPLHQTPPLPPARAKDDPDASLHRLLREADADGAGSWLIAAGGLEAELEDACSGGLGLPAASPGLPPAPAAAASPERWQPSPGLSEAAPAGPPSPAAGRGLLGWVLRSLGHLAQQLLPRPSPPAPRRAAGRRCAGDLGPRFELASLSPVTLRLLEPSADSRQASGRGSCSPASASTRFYSPPPTARRRRREVFSAPLLDLCGDAGADACSSLGGGSCGGGGSCCTDSLRGSAPASPGSDRLGSALRESVAACDAAAAEWLAGGGGLETGPSP